jgi:hypothetical protein
MGNPIVKFEGSYLVWSTVTDAPVTFGMTRDELIDWYRYEFGRAGVRELTPRLARVDEKGTSAIDEPDADATVWLNRAGPRETHLHRHEMIEFFIRRRERPTDISLAAFRRNAVSCDPCTFASGDACTCWGSGVRYPGNDPSETQK